MWRIVHTTVLFISATSFTLPVPFSVRKPLAEQTKTRASSAYYSTRDDRSDPEQADLDNYANQMNPNNDAYWSSRVDGDDDYDYFDDDCGSSNQADLDNHANQLNPNNDAYWSSRSDDDYDGGGGYSQADLDNHANQMNPNNDAYWSSRGG